jgi:hypothetical protein
MPLDVTRRRIDSLQERMTMMYAMHAALRRELERIALVTARPDDDPKHVQRTAAGWEMFKSYLQVRPSLAKIPIV